MTLSSDAKLFRMQLVQLMARANVSMGSIFAVIDLLEGWAGQSGGTERQMGNYWEIHHQLWTDHLKEFVRTGMFPEFGIMVDGTPTFASAEAFKLRAVTKEWEIVEVLLRVSLLAKGPNAEGLAANIEDVMEEFGLPIGNLRTAMKDRAATNQAALNLLYAKHDVNPFAADCLAHTNSHVPAKNITPEYAQPQKQWNKAIMHGGNCPLQFREIFGEMPKKARGVRFYVEWEQGVQLHKVGLSRLNAEVVQPCIEKKWAEKSNKKFALAAAKPEVMGRAIVQNCAASAAGREFCYATYVPSVPASLVLVLSLFLSIFLSPYISDFRLFPFRPCQAPPGRQWVHGGHHICNAR